MPDEPYPHKRKAERFEFRGGKKVRKFKELEDEFYNNIDEMFYELCKEDAHENSPFQLRKITMEGD